MGSSNPHHQADLQAIHLDPNNDGKEKIRVEPRGLNIVWGMDKRYWILPPERDNGPAELLQVCWLEVTGSVDITKPQNNYEVKFRVSLTPDAFGWGGSPIYIMTKKGKDGKPSWKKEFLTNHNGDEFDLTGKKPDGGDPGSTGPGKLYFGLYEVWSGKWKGGLKIHHVMVEEVD